MPAKPRIQALRRLTLTREIITESAVGIRTLWTSAGNPEVEEW